MNLIATVWSNRPSLRQARYTEPMPPAPISSSRRYGPIWVGGTNGACAEKIGAFAQSEQACRIGGEQLAHPCEQEEIGSALRDDPGFTPGLLDIQRSGEQRQRGELGVGGTGDGFHDASLTRLSAGA